MSNSTMNFRNIMAGRNIDIKNAEDYSLIDKELLIASIEAYETVSLHAIRFQHINIRTIP